MIYKQNWFDFVMSDKFDEMIENQMRECEYCGDLIPKQQMAEHVAWCKPMIEGNKK